jgi:hypothetical protein
MRAILLLMVSVLAAGCAVVHSGPLVAHLGAAGGDAAGFARIAEVFAANNPGYGLTWWPACEGVAAGDGGRICFVPAGRSRARVTSGASAPVDAEVTVGDLVLVRPASVVTFDDPIAICVFDLPDVPAAGVPVFVRPDWDPRITDTPGGCATEAGAYRRILLTWRGEVGPYNYRSLNAHRVRITDSFTHYHPTDGGFDEFYLVQMVQPGARLLTTDRVAEIEARSIGREDVPSLFAETPLAIGDLVYMPRGLAHRGLGGVLAQVITVPGFVPGKEIGIDHHLRAINQDLGLEGDDALPLHAPGAERAIVR